MEVSVVVTWCIYTYSMFIIIVPYMWAGMTIVPYMWASMTFLPSYMVFVFKMAAFNKQKESCLSQADLSKKGSIDDQIIDLVQYINAHENFFTTSSCSGRISVFSEVSVY